MGGELEVLVCVYWCPVYTCVNGSIRVKCDVVI